MRQGIDALKHGISTITTYVVKQVGPCRDRGLSPDRDLRLAHR
jgi:hypothetical protein